MRWFLLLAVLGLSVVNEASFAQGPPGDEVPGSTPSVDDVYHDSGYFASAGVARFQLIQGRLQLDAPRHRKGSQNREHGKIYESITVTACRGIPSLHYVFQSPRHQLTLSVQNATHVRLESLFPQTGERAVLDQRESGPITLKIDQGELDREFSGSTLLHLRLDDSTSFDLHFGRLVHRLLQGRSIKQLNQATEKALLKQIADERPINMDQIRDHVDQLRASKLAVRRTAEKQLIAYGTPILPIINSIAADELDAEQTARLRRIRRRLRTLEDDTPRTLATMLVNDRDHWSRLATRLDPQQIQLANAHLGRTGLSPLAPISHRPVERIASRPE